MLFNSTAMLEPDAPAIHYRSFSGVGPARSALRDQRTRGYSHGTDAARGDVDHHDSERALHLFALNALIEGEALSHSTFISEGLQMQSDGESGDPGTKGFLISLNEEDVELAGPDRILLFQVQIGPGNRDA